MRRAFLVGHLSLDKIELNKKVYFPVLGGAVAYAGVILRKLGYNVFVVSEVGTDFPKGYLDFLKSINIKTEFISQTSKYTTSYYLKYNKDGSRNLLLLKKAQSINLQHIDKLSSLISSGDLILLLPIINEIPEQYFDFFAERKGLYLTLDAQGLLRISRKGLIKLQKPEKQILSAIRKASLNLIKISYEEAQIFAQNARPLDLIKEIQKEMNVQNIILSLGERGIVGIYNGEIFKIPVLENLKSINPTGAGDVLLSSFVGLLAKGMPSRYALKLANKIASYSTIYMDPIDIYENIKIENLH